jgi:hypothetical protein
LVPPEKFQNRHDEIQNGGELDFLPRLPPFVRGTEADLFTDLMTLNLRYTTLGGEPVEKNAEIQELIERQKITDVLTRYAMALDSKNWPLLKTCFTPDAVADYGPEAGRHEGYPAIEKVVRFFLGGLSSQHLIGNFVIEIEGEKARATCYLQAQHYLEGTEGGDAYTIGGTYEDELIRTDEGWRIKFRKLTSTWVDGNSGVFEAAQAKRE